LIWIELQLGKIPIILTWIENVTVIAQVLGFGEEDQERFLKEREIQDQVLGILLLKTAFKDLHCLESIPEILENLGLNHSFIASLYALGHEDTLRSKGWIPQEENESHVRELFDDWIAQPASHDLPGVSEFLAEDKVELRSQVLGCNIVVEAPTNNRSLFIAESILAAFEAFLATSLDSELFPHQSNIRFQIIPSNSVADVIDFQIQTGNSTNLETHIKVQHSVHESYIADINPEKLSKKLAELVIQLVFHIAFVPDPEQYFDKLLREEFAFSRAFDFTNVATGIWNILGKTPKIRLADWQLNNTENKFPLRRAVVWNSGSTQTNSVEQMTQTTSVKPKPGQGEIPPELRSLNHLKHRDRKVYSLLDINLWNKASWKGTGVVFVPSTKQNPPLLALALLFQNRDECKQIFSQWNHELGNEDIEERIRVSIITGIDSDNPAAYRVVIGVNPDRIQASDNSQFVMTYRINTMEPKDSKNLNQFVDFFDKLGFYILMRLST
jgi:hypothetical protein